MLVRCRGSLVSGIIVGESVSAGGAFGHVRGESGDGADRGEVEDGGNGIRMVGVGGGVELPVWRSSEGVGLVFGRRRSASFEGRNSRQPETTSWNLVSGFHL